MNRANPRRAAGNRGLSALGRPGALPTALQHRGLAEGGSCTNRSPPSRSATWPPLAGGASARGAHRGEWALLARCSQLHSVYRAGRVRWRRMMGSSIRMWAPLVVVVALVVAACGTGAVSDGSGQGQEGGGDAPSGPGFRSSGSVPGTDAGSGDAPPASGGFSAVSTGEWHSCGLRSDGSISCWGSNGEGQANPPDGAFTDVAAGSAHSCGLASDGSISCWGSNRERASEPTRRCVHRRSRRISPLLRAGVRRIDQLLGKQRRGASEPTRRCVHRRSRRISPLLRAGVGRIDQLLGLQPQRASEPTVGCV